MHHLIHAVRLKLLPSAQHQRSNTLPVRARRGERAADRLDPADQIQRAYWMIETDTCAWPQKSFLKPKCCPFSQCTVNQEVTGEHFSFHTDCLLCLQPPMGEEGGRRRHHSTSAGDEGRRRRHPSNSTSKPTQAPITAAQNTPKDSTQKTAAAGQGKKSESGARGKKESAKKWSPLV